MNERLLRIWYVLADVASGVVSWSGLYIFRKRVIEGIPGEHWFDIPFDPNFYLGLLVVPMFWVILHYIAGSYSDLLRRHRIKEIGGTLVVSLIGVLLLFFTLLLDDHVDTYTDYYQSVLFLLFVHLGVNLTLRLFITSRTVRMVHSGKIGFKTILVGGNERAVAAYEEIVALPYSPGFHFVGFVRVNGRDNLLEGSLPCLGIHSELEKVVIEHGIEEVILAIESSDHKVMQEIMNQTDGMNVRVKIIPDMYDILSGSVRMTAIWGAPLVKINTEIMPHWQFAIKRLMDMLISAIALVLLIPVFLIIAIAIKMSSKGPVFFVQERIGKGGKVFNIIKFRTMRCDAEADGPQLSSANDSRITGVGKFLRKSRLDELPQFWNVLKGDMSLVGPRPERQFFINQIVLKAPHYKHLHKVRPGITSWGQVKFGYAENVDQMVQRLKYDVLYIENMSLAMDIKILFYTVLIVLKGKGK